MHQNKNKTGRPSKMTGSVLGKLREAFLWGATDEEACLFAQIHPSTLYDHQVAHPEFTEEKKGYKSNPILKARKLVVERIEAGDVKTAKWYLERKRKSEFGKDAEPSEDQQPRTIGELFLKIRQERDAEQATASANGHRM